MTARDTKTLLRAAFAAVRDCADTMETHAESLLQALPEMSMDETLRPTVVELSAGLKDTAGRVMFELALLQVEFSEGKADVATAVQRLSNLDSTMMTALDASADVVSQLEKAAERDEDNEPAFALVMQATRMMLRKFGNARAATEVLPAAAQVQRPAMAAEPRAAPPVRAAADGSVVVLEVGAEGGAVTLFGRPIAGGRWQFARLTDDQTEALFGDSGAELTAPPAVKPEDWVENWAEALRLMDRYQWARLHPVAVHPEFVERVRAAVEERLAAEGSDGWTEYRREKWERVFSDVSAG
jgi:hypothetical protein